MRAQADNLVGHMQEGVGYTGNGGDKTPTERTLSAGIHDSRETICSQNMSATRLRCDVWCLLQRWPYKLSSEGGQDAVELLEFPAELWFNDNTGFLHNPHEPIG